MNILYLFFLLVSVSANAAVSHEFLFSSGKKIEYFWSKPEGAGPWPVLLMIHPHQEWRHKIGGAAFVINGQLDHWAEKHFVPMEKIQGLMEGFLSRK